MNTRTRRKLTWVAFRDALMFFGGLGAFVWQVVTGKSDPWLLGAALSMMGGPAVLNSVAMAITSRGSGTESPQSPSVQPGSVSPTSGDSSGSTN